MVEGLAGPAFKWLGLPCEAPDTRCYQSPQTGPASHRPPPGKAGEPQGSIFRVKPPTPGLGESHEIILNKKFFKHFKCLQDTISMRTDQKKGGVDFAN